MWVCLRLVEERVLALHRARTPLFLTWTVHSGGTSRKRAPFSQNTMVV